MVIGRPVPQETNMQPPIPHQRAVFHARVELCGSKQQQAAAAEAAWHCTMMVLHVSTYAGILQRCKLTCTCPWIHARVFGGDAIYFMINLIEEEEEEQEEEEEEDEEWVASTRKSGD